MPEVASEVPTHDVTDAYSKRNDDTSNLGDIRGDNVDLRSLSKCGISKLMAFRQSIPSFRQELRKRHYWEKNIHTHCSSTLTLEPNYQDHLEWCRGSISKYMRTLAREQLRWNPQAISTARNMVWISMYNNFPTSSERLVLFRNSRLAQGPKTARCTWLWFGSDTLDYKESSPHWVFQPTFRPPSNHKTFDFWSCYYWAMRSHTTNLRQDDMLKVV